MEKICKNCRLYNEKEKICSVVIMFEGERYELPVLPYDNCHWERTDGEVQDLLKSTLEELKTEKFSATERKYFQAKLEQEIDSPIEIKQFRAWSDGKDGYIET